MFFLRCRGGLWSGRGHVRVAWLGVERTWGLEVVVLRRRLRLELRLELGLTILNPRAGVVILLLVRRWPGVLDWLVHRAGGVHVGSEVEMRPEGGGGRTDPPSSPSRPIGRGRGW